MRWALVLVCAGQWACSPAPPARGGGLSPNTPPGAPAGSTATSESSDRMSREDFLSWYVSRSCPLAVENCQKHGETEVTLESCRTTWERIIAAERGKVPFEGQWARQCVESGLEAAPWICANALSGTVPPGEECHPTTQRCRQDGTEQVHCMFPNAEAGPTCVAFQHGALGDACDTTITACKRG